MKIIIKTFEELNITELYEILQLRSEVFVVEQDCVYQDIDGKDDKALHILGVKDEKVIAYTRCFNKEDYFTEASIGRVVVKETERKYHYGNEIMKNSIEAIETHFQTETIKISAQVYLQKFYNQLGFDNVGEEYLEDGIPHINMLKRN